MHYEIIKLKRPFNRRYAIMVKYENDIERIFVMDRKWDKDSLINSCFEDNEHLLGVFAQWNMAMNFCNSFMH